MKNFLKRTLRVIYNFQTMDEMYRGQRDVWTKIKWFSGRVIRNVSIVASYVVIGFGTAKIYNYMAPVTVYADREVIVTVQATSTAPILERIAICESNGNHLDKSGQVQIHINTNGTVDIGKYMVNQTVWGKQATKLGLDLTKEKDNEKMAEWIYANRGTQDWYASQKCWSR